MFHALDVDEVIEIASSLGFHLRLDEAQLYQQYIVDQMRALDEFVQSRRIDEVAPPMRASARAPGRRPTADEDPLNAWAWKCNIQGEPEGLLAGKSVSFKDHIPVAGIPASFGSFPLEGFIPDFDATVVTRVLEAGGTIIGKNVMNGFTGGLVNGGGIGDYGRPLNPHNRAHVTGGSSAGSAAAVAAGEVDISFGGDQGGSIRVPAAFSGTVGLKPTFGLISHFGIGFGVDQSVDHVGPMARRVEDCAAALQATAGYDGLDPRQSRDVPNQLDVLTGLDRGVKGLRIGVLEEGFDGAGPDVADLVRAAVEQLAAIGARVSRVSVPAHLTAGAAASALMFEGDKALVDTSLFGAFTRTYYPASLIAVVNAFWATQADLLDPRRKANLIVAHLSRETYRGRVYAKAQNVRPTFVRAFDKALTEVDVLVMPTSIMTAPRYEAPSTLLEAIEQNLGVVAHGMFQNTIPFNYTGHPALAVPVGKSRGLPVSMQLVGRFFDDPLLLSTAYAFQQANDWDEIIGLTPS